MAFFDHHRNFLDGERLLDEIERAQLGGFHRGLDGAVAGDDDDHGAVGERALLDAGQRFQAVHAGQPDVQQHQIVGRVVELLAAFFAGGDGVGLVALVFEHAGQRLADERLVIDDEDAGGLHERLSRRDTSATLVSSSAASGSAAV